MTPLYRRGVGAVSLSAVRLRRRVVPARRLEIDADAARRVKVVAEAPLSSGEEGETTG